MTIKDDMTCFRTIVLALSDTNDCPDAMPEMPPNTILLYTIPFKLLKVAHITWRC